MASYASMRSYLSEDMHIKDPPEFKFIHAACQNASDQLDKSRGRVYNLNGDIFYSPNCARDVRLPSRFPKDAACITRDPKIDDIKELYDPLWWSKDYAHLAFLSIDPFSTGLYDYLMASTPYVHKHNRRLGYSLDAGQVLEWNRLQFAIRTTVNALVDRSHVLNFPSVIENALVCTGFHKDLNTLRDLISRCQGWFSYWLCRLSFTIAATLTVDNESVNDMQYKSCDGIEEADGMLSVSAWYRDLATHLRWHQGYLSELQAVAGVFLPEYLRVGVFLNVLNPDKHQYSVDWFAKFYVPVWYPWGASEIQAASCSTLLARLAPPVHELQDATTFLSKPVSSPGTSNARLKHDELAQWSTWLQDRQEREAVILASMSDSKRQAVESRKKQPPKKKCQVYVWSQGPNGSLVRERVSSKHNEHILGDFGRNQKVYNAVFNEWDCWDAAGEMDEDEVDREDWDYDPEDTFLTPQVLPPPSTSRVNIDSEHEPLEQESSDARAMDTISMQGPLLDLEPYQFDVAQFEALEILREYYGFVPSHPLTPLIGAQALHEPEKIKFSQFLGFREPDEEFFAHDVSAQAVNFLKSFAGTPPKPDLDLWDLGNRASMLLQSNDRFLKMKLLSEGGYLFDFGKKTTVRWKILVPNAVHALFICRLDRDLDDYTVAFTLLQRGIKFATVLPFSSESNERKQRNISTLPLPVRLPGYQFDVHDYAAYVQTRNKLLQNPRIARAAMLRGGIIWRLAINCISFATVLQGPTASVSSGSLYSSVKDDMFLGDDTCTTRELELISGGVVCMTDKASYAVIKWWWPPPDQWDLLSGQLHWSDAYEKLYESRLEKIQLGEVQPLTAKQWRKTIRAPSQARHIKKNSEQLSCDFIKGMKTI